MNGVSKYPSECSLPIFKIKVVISTKDESTVPIPLAMIDLLKVDWWRPVVDLKSTIASQSSKHRMQASNLESVNEKIRCIEVDYPIVSCNKDPATHCQTEKTQFEFPLVTTPKATVSDQRELQTMVDAIAAASQREAEAHEIADNQQNISRAEESQRDHVDQTEFVQKELEMKRENNNLEHQLIEMHEENDKLLGLYEKEMQERDEFQRLLSSGGLETRDGEANCDLSCEPHFEETAEENTMSLPVRLTFKNALQIYEFKKVHVVEQLSMVLFRK
ncbi:kinesin-like protein KIN-12E [Tanacetum coccineum]|uniref:Kinesin-like protein KIN-12E n=1 Tax=Tanacetum coccineum TaxID=301880 RepID=A0ABQ4WFE1_9ASTR